MPSPLPDIGKTIRNIRRAQEILKVFAEYGFDDVIQEIKLDRVLFEGKRFFGMVKQDATLVREPQAVRLRQAMEKLGPTFIKMAQILATRRDLIPEEWADEFAKLQHAVPASSAEKIRPHIESLYGGRLEEHFKEVEFEAFAAASMAQAHRATLHDGTEVILKILRPEAKTLIEQDVEILRVLAAFVEEHFEGFGYSPKLVVEQFERQVKRETDLRLEGQNVNRLRSAFEDDGRIGFPKVYREHGRDGALCLERIDGVLLSSPEARDFNEDQRRAIVAAGADAVFRQCFEIGFFHADPHPGNMFVVEDAEAPGGVRVVFIDLGMVGHIDPRTRELLADLVQGTVTGELDRVISVVLELTDGSPMMATDRAFRADVWEFISRFQAGTLADLQMGALLSDLFAKIRQHRLECPADIVYLIKAITTIEGVGEQVCPTFDIIGHVRPHTEGLVKQRYGPAAIKDRLQAGALGYAELLEQAPRDARDLLRMIRRDKVVIKLEHQGAGRLTDELENASRNISNALLVSSLILGGSILILADAAQGAGWGLLTIAGVVSTGGAFALVATRFVQSRLR